MIMKESGDGTHAIIFIHGFLCRPDEWARQAAFFSTTHRVLVCSLRGHGAEPSDDHPRTIEAYGDDILSAVAELKLRSYFIVGHSMGCRIAIEAGARANTGLRGIALIDGSRIGSFAGAGLPGFAEELDQVGYGEFVRGLFDDMFLGEMPDWGHSLVKAALRIEEGFGRALLTDIAKWDENCLDAALSRISVPVLALQSTALVAEGRRTLQPDEVAAYQRHILDRVAQARSVTIAGTHHFCQVTRPDEVNRELAHFFESCARGGG